MNPTLSGLSSTQSKLPGQQTSSLTAKAKWWSCRFQVLPAWALSLGVIQAIQTGEVSRAAESSPAAVEFISDHPEYILVSQQAWGVLGCNVAAHAAGQAGMPLRIGATGYAKGLGHHATGAIVVLLEGQYAAFDAVVGLQPARDGGSVVFRVHVDGEKRFDSGVMRASDPPRPVHVSVTGAAELRLEADEAGDGITCDMANWAEARLTRSTQVASATAEPPVDVAPFGLVATWDPGRDYGTRADRTREFPAEDLFLETELRPGDDGFLHVPVGANGLACVGLQWLNRRALKTLTLELAGASPLPDPVKVQVQAWFGESIWQGEWRPLQGKVTAEGRRLVFQAGLGASGDGLLHTWKVRWIFPAQGQPVLAQRLSAFTRSSWATVRLRAQRGAPAQALDRPDREDGRLTVLNGQLVKPPQLRIPAKGTRTFAVRYSRTAALYSDPTVLSFRLGPDTVSMAVADVLTNECVYLRDHALLVCRDDRPVSLADYRQRIARRKTVRAQVHELPEQGLAQALANTHHEAQNEGPVMLSLACHNWKCVLERNGDLSFQLMPIVGGDWYASAAKMTTRLGGGVAARGSRRLDGGWLPAPVITSEAANGLVLRQRCFVAPADGPFDQVGPLTRRSVCVAEFALSNASPAALQAHVQVAFEGRQPVRLQAEERRLLILHQGRPVGWLALPEDQPLAARAEETTLSLMGNLPPATEAQWTVYLSADSLEPLSLPPATTLRAALADYWRATLAPATQIETPEPFLNDLIRSSQARCLIAARNEAEGGRIAPWIAALAYGPLESEAHSVVRGMDFLGHGDFAQRSLDFFVHRYNTNGFLTTGYTTFGTAWHLWALGEHWQLTRDTNWLRSIAPEIARVGVWIVSQTRKTRQAGAPHFGLMPPGVMADWNAYACHFMMNGYYHAALRELGVALSDLRHAQASSFLAAAAELRANILRAYRWTQAQSPALPLRDGTWIPHYPSQVHSPGPLAWFFPGQDAGRAWAYDVELGAHQLAPTGVLEPRSREVEQMLDHMEDFQFLSDGWFDYRAADNQRDWFNLGGFAKVQPYYGRNAEIYALRDEIKPFLRSYFNSLASLVNREVLAFWEHFRHSGAWDKTHETGYFLHQTRTMLVTERGDELWLAPLIPARWLLDGLTVSVTNAPTRFGPASYCLTSRVSQGRIEATVQPPTRNPPEAIVLRLRHPEGRPLRSVLVNGRRHMIFSRDSETIRLLAPAAPLTLQANY
jgi:hypothetical protein